MGTAINPNFNPGGTEPITDPNNAIRYLDNERQLADQRLSLVGKELIILEAILKEQMTDNQYAETRKRIEADLFPPPPSIDHAEMDRLKEDMMSMQKDAADYRNESQGMFRDLAEGIKEMTAYAHEMRERAPGQLYPMEEDLDRGTDVPAEPLPEVEDLPEPVPVDYAEEPPPYICPNCNEKIPNANKNQHVCKQAVAPKKPKKK